MRLPASLLLIGVVGCLDVVDPLDPQVGPALAPRCANQDGDPDTDISFSRDLLPIFLDQSGSVGCGCHNPAAPNPIGVEETGLDLSSYTGVRAGGVNSLASIVIAGAPCDSILWQKVSPGPPFGSRMPFNGPPFLDESTIELIADWIAEGARDN